MIELLIFDMDGLLLDTETIYQTIFLRSTKELGYNGTENIYKQCIGIGDENIKALLKNTFGPAFPTQRWEEMSRLYIKEYIEQNGVALKPGVAEMLDLAEKLGLKKAVASSNEKNFVHYALERSKIKERFSVINTAGDVQYTKPAPDLFLKTARDHGVQAQRCIVFEDSENGVLAAERAGMRVCMIPDLKQPSDEIKAKTHRLYTSMHEAKELFV